MKEEIVKRGYRNRIDPRQALFLRLYVDPKSDTFANALQSAIKAGFTKQYASKITGDVPLWLEGGLKDTTLLNKAERNLNEILDLPNETQAVGAFGRIYDKETKEPVMELNTGILKVKADVSKFVAERIGRKKYGADVPIAQVAQATVINLIVPNGQGNTDNKLPAQS